MFGGFDRIIDLAVVFTTAKFPSAMNNYPKNKFVLHQVVELVADELVTKNGQLFIKDYTKNFVNFNDLKYGNKNIFEFEIKD